MVNYIFNPGTKDFEFFLKSKILVDKTELIYYLNKVINTPERFICVARPRCYGKTTIVNMLSAYYSFSEKKTKIFDNKKIAKIKRWDKYLGKFNVIKLNVSTYFEMNSVKKGLKLIRKDMLTEIKENEPEIKFKNEDNIVSIFEDIYKYTNKQIVLIIDEWDILIRYKRNEEAKIYMNFLISIIKDKSYIALAYITGIFPIKRYGTQTSLDFDEYTMFSSSWTSRFFGFTKKEVKMLCKNLIDNEKLDSDNNKHKMLNNEEEIKCKKQANYEKRKFKENISNKELINSNNIINKKQNENKDLINKKDEGNKKRKINQSNHESECKKIKLEKELNNKEGIICKKIVNNKKESKCKENIINKELINTNNIIIKKQIENKDLINKKDEGNKKRKINQSIHESKSKKIKLEKELNNEEGIICKEIVNNKKESKCKENIINKELINSNNIINKKQNEKNKIINKKQKINQSNKESEFEFKINYKNIKKWYNGYRLYDEESCKTFKLYPTYSIINAFKKGVLTNYWIKTKIVLAISEYINMDFFGLKEDIIRLENGKSIKINTNSYQNDMTSFNCKDDVLTMLVHLGYLSYNAKTRKVFIPNEEVLQEFLYYTQSENWKKVVKKLEKSKKLLKETLKCNEKKVAKLMEEFHDEACNKDYNSESALRYAILLGYYVSDEYYNSFLELDSGKGYIDIAYIPYNLNSKYPALVVELKYEKDVKTALNQIKKRKYPQKLEPYKDNMLLIGINYNKEADPNNQEYKHHTCTIEKFNNHD